MWRCLCILNSFLKILYDLFIYGTCNELPSKNKNKTVSLRDLTHFQATCAIGSPLSNPLSIPDPCGQMPTVNLLRILHRHPELNMPAHSIPQCTPQSDSPEDRQITPPVTRTSYLQAPPPLPVLQGLLMLLSVALFPGPQLPSPLPSHLFPVIAWAF